MSLCITIGIFLTASTGLLSLALVRNDPPKTQAEPEVKVGQPEAVAEGRYFLIQQWRLRDMISAQPEPAHKNTPSMRNFLLLPSKYNLFKLEDHRNQKVSFSQKHN